MQATTATCLLGGSGNGPEKVFAYSALLARYSSVTPHGLLPSLTSAAWARCAAGPPVHAPGRPRHLPCAACDDRPGSGDDPVPGAPAAQLHRVAGARVVFDLHLTSYTFTPLNSLLQRNPRPPQAVIDAKAAELDLDKPVPLRYAHWVSGAVRGDFGTTVNGQPVSDELWRRIGVSLRLLVIGSVLGTVIGVVVGAWGPFASTGSPTGS